MVAVIIVAGTSRRGVLAGIETGEVAVVVGVTIVVGLAGAMLEAEVQFQF